MLSVGWCSSEENRIGGIGIGVFWGRILVGVVGLGVYLLISMVGRW